MAQFKDVGPMGVAPTFIVMGLIYLVFMMFGVFTIRVPAEGWKPEGYVPKTNQNSLITMANVDADAAIKTPQFWLLWVVLCMNVTAGIGVLESASPLIQESFSDTAMGVGRGVTAAAAAGFVGLLSLFNLLGRFFWSSASDKLGRKPTYMIYFGLGIALYALVPTLAANASLALFVISCCVIMSMYGGGFATIPAYLRDMFGTMQVGAIHGRLLTAWSTAGILGPLLVNYLRDNQKAKGLTGPAAYQTVFYTMAALLAVGFIANLLITAVNERYHHRESAKAPVPA
jgi:MFS family permease